MGRTPPGETRAKIFQFVRDRLLQGAPPTIREVQEAFALRSPHTAQHHLQTLVREGRLSVQEGKARGVRLPASAGSPPVLVPLLGRVVAGPLSTAIEEAEGHVATNSRHASSDLFALRVRGDSMVGAAILDGDIVVVRRQPRAESGDIVVAMVGEEATVKRLWMQRGRVELRPENPRLSPIVLKSEELRILGRVVEVRRSLERR